MVIPLSLLFVHFMQDLLRLCDKAGCFSKKNIIVLIILSFTNKNYVDIHVHGILFIFNVQTLAAKD